MKLTPLDETVIQLQIRESQRDTLRQFIANPYDKKAQAAVRKAFPGSFSSNERERINKTKSDELTKELERIQQETEKELKRLRSMKTEELESSLDDISKLLIHVEQSSLIK